MIQFDFNRFGKLARWTLTMDRRWFVKTVLSWLVVLTLMFLFFTRVVNYDNAIDGFQDYQSCAFMAIFMFFGIFVVGGAQMFQSMKSRDDDQRLLLLPASNLEKFLMRYSLWILLLPCLLGAFVVADLVQWLVNTLTGHEHTMLVMQYMSMSSMGLHWMPGVPRTLGVSIVLTIVWLHSFYTLGATFFRSHKYNWILTSIVLIVGGIVMAVPGANDYLALHIDEHTAIALLWVWNGAYVLLILLNFWLSYRLFCRTQLIGRFVNL